MLEVVFGLVKAVTVSNPNLGTYEKLALSSVQEMRGGCTREVYTRYHFTTSAGGNITQMMETWTSNPDLSGADQMASDSLEYLSDAPLNEWELTF